MSVEDQMNATLTSINNLLLQEGSLIRFSPAAGSMEPLEKSLVKVMQAFQDKEHAEDRQNAILSQKTADRSRNKVFKEHTEAIKKVIEKTSRTKQDSDTKQWNGVSQYLKDLKKSSNTYVKKFGELYGITSGVYQTLKGIYGIAKDSSLVFNGLAKDRLQTVAALREAGIFLKNGFDESFDELAKASGRDYQQFIDILQKNAKFNAQLNAAGLDGASIISKASKTLVTSMGLTTREADSVIQYFGEMMHTTANDTRLASMNFDSEIASTAMMLRQLSVATGQSKDQIIAHSKEQARTWQLERMRTDPRYKGIYTVLKAIGMPEGAIEGLLLNKPTEELIKAQFTSGGASAVAALQKAVNRAKGLPEDQASMMIMQAINSPAFNGYRKQEAWLNNHLEDYAYFNEAGYSLLSATPSLGNLTNLDIEAALKAGKKTTEDRAIESYNNLQAAINELHATLKKAISPKMETIARFYDIFQGPIETISRAIAEYPNLALGLFWGGQIVSTVGGFLINIAGPALTLALVTGGAKGAVLFKNALITGGSIAAAAINTAGLLGAAGAGLTAKSPGEGALKGGAIAGGTGLLEGMLTGFMKDGAKELARGNWKGALVKGGMSALKKGARDALIYGTTGAAVGAGTNYFFGGSADENAAAAAAAATPATMSEYIQNPDSYGLSGKSLYKKSGADVNASLNQPAVTQVTSTYSSISVSGMPTMQSTMDKMARYLGDIKSILSTKTFHPGTDLTTA